MRVLIAVVLAGILHSAVAQPIIQFDGPTNQWYVAASYPQGNISNPNFISTTTSRYFLDGDSIIDGELWSRMFVQGAIAPLPTALFQGLVRQTADVVLFRDDQAVVDTLYNFGLQVGDSMRYVSSFYDTYLPVVAMDSIVLQGAYHKVFRFGQHPLSLEELLSDTWIEGIGSIHGPLAPRMPSSLGFNFGMPDSTRTTCFLKNDLLIWNHPSYAACAVNVLLGVSSLNAGPLLRINPNPGSSFQLTGLNGRTAQLRVLDMQGRTVRDSFMNSERRTVDAEDLPPGTYIVEVHFADGARQALRWVKE